MGSEALTFIMRVLGCGCLGHRGLLKIGARVSPTRMETRTVLRWTLKMRASGGWTWIAAKRTTGCPTTLSVRRLFRHNCPTGRLENIILKKLRYESSTLILHKELSSSIFQVCQSVSE